jgi:DNA topoisomerase I
MTVVGGVPKYDPELGGEALDVEEVPDPIHLTFVSEQAPPAKKATKKRTKKATAKKTTAKKATAKKATRKKAKKRTS